MVAKAKSSDILINPLLELLPKTKAATVVPSIPIR